MIIKLSCYCSVRLFCIAAVSILLVWGSFDMPSGISMLLDVGYWFKECCWRRVVSLCCSKPCFCVQSMWWSIVKHCVVVSMAFKHQWAQWVQLAFYKCSYQYTDYTTVQYLQATQKSQSRLCNYYFMHSNDRNIELLCFALTQVPCLRQWWTSGG